MFKTRTITAILLLATSLMIPCISLAEHEAAYQTYQTAQETYKQARAENDRLREQKRLACRASNKNRDACNQVEAAWEAAFERAKEAYAAFKNAKALYEEARRRHR